MSVFGRWSSWARAGLWVSLASSSACSYDLDLATLDGRVGPCAEGMLAVGERCVWGGSDARALDDDAGRVDASSGDASFDGATDAAPLDGGGDVGPFDGGRDVGLDVGLDAGRDAGRDGYAEDSCAPASTTSEVACSPSGRPVAGNEVVVHSLCELRAALGGSSMSRTITVAEGRYTFEGGSTAARTLTIDRVPSGGDIVVRAERVGAVVFDGDVQVVFEDAAHIVFDGFVLRPSSSTRELVVVRDSTDITISRTRFEPTAIATTRPFLTWTGTGGDHVLSHSEFRGPASGGPWGAAFVEVGGSGSLSVAGNEIEHCLFERYTGQNEVELVTVGSSVRAATPDVVALHDNVFRDLHAASGGTIALVALEASTSSIERNSFLGNDGTVAVRAGDASRVSANFFADGQQGVRVTGPTALEVTNNVFTALTDGAASAAALSLGASSSRHVVAFNTFATVDVAVAWQTGTTGLVFVNNLLQGGGRIAGTSGSLAASGGNYAEPSAGAVTPFTGTSVTLTVTQRVPRHDATTAAALAGVVSTELPTVDFDGATRSSPPDSGADEHGGIFRPPLTTADVGACAP